MTGLKAIAAKVQKCTECRLHKCRTNPVPGIGPKSADIMVIGEAPGEEEDRGGEPFIGRSGRLLTRLMDRAGIDRQAVFVTNTVKCRPPDNRTPLSDELDACRGYLRGQIKAVKPRLVILVGATAYRALFGSEKSISQVRGSVIRSTKSGLTFLPVYHPAFALRNPEAKKILAKDLKLAARLILK